MLLFAFNFANAQTYTDPTNIGNTNNYYINRIILGDIDNSTTSSNSSKYTYYSGVSATINKIGSYTGSIGYSIKKNNVYYIRIWIDYNDDGDFLDANEEIYSYNGNSSTTEDILQPFSFTVPSGASTATTRMRVAIKHSTTNGAPTPTYLGNQAGEVEDYDIVIKPNPTDPTAVCLGSVLDVNLDIFGNGSITADQLNNGSTDDYDAPEDLILSLDQTTFTCEDLGENTVELTVTDSDGLTDKCEATVNVIAYSGAFTTPTLPTINAYCSYTAVAPIMDYQCGQEITPSTSDPTTLTSSGTITWSYFNGTTTETSVQTINILSPISPINVLTSNITETTARISWTPQDQEEGPYKIQYKTVGASTWNTVTSSEASVLLTGLSKGTEYNVQVAVNANCASYTSGSDFTTLDVPYCNNASVNISKNNKFYVSNTIIGAINNTSGKNDGPYVYYDNLSITATAGTNLSGSISYTRPTWANPTTCKIWIDYNQDGDFEDANEEILSRVANSSEASVVETFSNITIPTTALSGTARIRVSMSHNTPVSACNYSYEEGDIEDYDIFIRPVPTAPTAACIGGTLDVNLDVSGNVTITPDQINNGSTDDFDASGNLILSLDKTTFTCNDLGDNTVTLTVTDSDGLTDTCTATVNIAPYAGAFSAPILDTINVYCSPYVATTPVMDYLCETEITGTTADTTVFNSTGTYSIDWTFDNGSTVVTSTQIINVITPSTPTNVFISNITETTAVVNWDDIDQAPYRIQYREVGSGTWLETTSSLTSISLTGLNNGSNYEAQVKVDATCTSYSTLATFTTVQIDYCDENDTDINQSNNYYISNTNINSDEIDQNSGSGPYVYYTGTSTTAAVGGTISGSVTYTKQSGSDAGFKVWIDYNQDGDFDDAGEEIYSSLNTSSNTTITEDFLNILIPIDATTGKTRIRVAMTQDILPTNACTYSGKNGDIEDYDLYITPRDTSLFENCKITQVYQNTKGEKWIEVTNTGVSSIPTNTIILALYKDTSGDQTGVLPTATYKINKTLAAGESAIIKGSGSSLSNYNGVPLVDVDVTEFSGADDILIITDVTGTTAWVNRFDVIFGIEDDTSYVRNDEVLTYNTTYTPSEWTAFVNNNLDPYRDLANGGPERHPNAPLLSEVNNADADSNARIGIHNVGATSFTSGSWNNGPPDRSRYVIIDENYEENSNGLKARKLSVTGDNKLTLSNQALIVTNGIEINSSAEIRLAGSSQLVQTHTGTKQITGTGKVFIDRNTTNASIYRFSYYSSPVNSIGKTTYTLSDVLKDGTIPTSSSSSAVNINFVSGYDGAKTDPISISEYWIYTYKSTTGSTDDYVHKGALEYIQQTDGFTMKGTGVAQNYTYVGTPKDGVLTADLDYDESYLVGNPYPSAISAKKFIEDNEDVITGTLYFWQQVESSNENHNAGGYVGGYATRNKTMGTAADNVVTNTTIYAGPDPVDNSLYKAPASYIPVGQAFFVQGDSNGGTLTFNNSQREFNKEEDGESVFFKTAETSYLNLTNKIQKVIPVISNSNKVQTPLLKLGMDYKNADDLILHRQLGISFKANNSFAYDKGYDSESYNISDTDIYWKFPNDDKKYVIAGVESISEELEVPLEIVMGYDGELIIKVDEWKAIDRDVYLKDKVNNTFTKINENKATLNLTQNTYSNRFYLAFDNSGFLETDNINTQVLSVVYDKDTKDIEISNTENLDIYKVELFNIFGQQVKSWTTDSKTYYVGALTPAVYIVKVMTDSGEVKKKLFIK